MTDSIDGGCAVIFVIYYCVVVKFGILQDETATYSIIVSLHSERKPIW